MPCWALDPTSRSPSPNSVSIHPIQETTTGLPSIVSFDTSVQLEISNSFTTEIWNVMMSPDTQTQIGLEILETTAPYLVTFSLWLEQP